MVLQHSPWKNGAKRGYALSGPIPEYWPMYNSEKKMGKAITSTIITNGMRNAPAKREETFLLFNLQDVAGTQWDRGSLKFVKFFRLSSVAKRPPVVVA